MVFGPENEGVENGANDDGSRESCVPMIANASADSKCVREWKISDGNKDDMEADDDEGANWEVGDDGWC